jgi:hypothetical protein
MTRWCLPKARSGVVSVVALVGALGSSGCTGILDGEGMDSPGSGASSSQGSGTGNGGSGATGATPGGGSTASSAPGYKAIHRLNGNEYNATVADVLGTQLQPANGAWQVYEINGFDNMADVQRVNTDQFQRFFDAAGALAKDAFTRADFKAKWVTCTTSDEACVSGIVAKLGLHLFRRPLATTEVANYEAVYDAAQKLGESHEASLEHVLRALLGSSEFLYRMEFDPNPASTERHALSSYELASRLSYFLWSSAPDDALLTAAADDSLSKDETIKATVHRMLADPARSTRFVQNFYGQWLGARHVAEHAVAPDVYKTWNPELAASLAQEMYAYFADFLQNDRSYLEFLTADQNFVNAPLAALYGMPAPAAAGGLQKVVDTSDARAGFLGLAGFLAQSSLDRRTSPTLRGRWVMINLLCTHPPPPPQDVPKIETAAGTTDLSKGNVRAVLEKHRTNPACASCHKLFDPYGLPLEQFDGIGAYRPTYADGSVIVPDTELLDGTKLTGLNELADSLTKDPRFTQCVADNLYSYGLGRLATEADRGVLDGIKNSWKNDKDVPSIRRLIETITLDPAFRSRSGQAL